LLLSPAVEINFGFSTISPILAANEFYEESSQMNRKTFIRTGVAGLAGIVTGVPGLAVAQTKSEAYPDFPAQDRARVRDVVRYSHFDLARVRELVTDSPALACASWDWGFGDWESALGAASHMGRRDIAEFLLEHGARANLFTATMLGQLAVVKATIAARPRIQRVLGPHGLTLLTHARHGGEQAAQVVDYLESLGDADIGQPSLETSEAEKQMYLGKYILGDETFEIVVPQRGSLGFQRNGDFPRFLHRVAEHEFAPAGAPAVRFRFEIADERAFSFTIHDGNRVVTGRRV
jgi:hypothetical protein